MNRHDFLKEGSKILEFLGEYLEQGNVNGPVYPNPEPNHFLQQLPLHPPEHPESPETLFQDFKDKIFPGLTHWNDPRFFGYFPCNNSFASVLGEMLAAGMGVNTFSWLTSPSATELEMRVMEWTAQALGLPAWKGCLQDTASMGVFSAMLAARERVWNANERGLMAAPPLTIYWTSETHSSCLKAARMAGLGNANVRLVPTLPDLSMCPERLSEMIQKDRTEGCVPCFVVATLGSTSTTAVDPLESIGLVCEREKVWLHVDAALGGTALLLPALRWMIQGIERADSFVFNPHKWMFTNFDCSAFFVRNPLDLLHALALEPEYLRGQHDQVTNFRDWGPQLGRRFRALKLWFVYKSFGLKGLQEKVELHLKMAQSFAGWVQSQPHLQLHSKPLLNTVCFSAGPNESTQSLHLALNRSGEVFLTHTKINDKYLIRASFGQTNAQMGDVERLQFQILRAKN